MHNITLHFIFSYTFIFRDSAEQKIFHFDIVFTDNPFSLIMKVYDGLQLLGTVQYFKSKTANKRIKNADTI